MDDATVNKCKQQLDAYHNKNMYIHDKSMHKQDK